MRHRQWQGEDRRRERKWKRVGQTQKRWQTMEKKVVEGMAEKSITKQGSSMILRPLTSS